MWEWMQSPFYQDVSIQINEIVWFRIHCTLVDVLIMLGSAVFIAAARRKPGWFTNPRPGDFALLTAAGVLYTAISEYVNVEILGRWAYSALMPRIPVLGSGLVPLLQWLLLPTLVLLLTRGYLRGLLLRANHNNQESLKTDSLKDAEKSDLRRAGRQRDRAEEDRRRRECRSGSDAAQPGAPESTPQSHLSTLRAGEDS